ncbi:MAG: hypothetical protein AB7O73_05690 [Bacteroidia bacterium]
MVLNRKGKTKWQCNMYWENYFIKAGDEFSPFWKSYLTEDKRDVLFIMGIGFDPRTNVGIKAIYSNKSEGLKDTIALRYYKQVEDIGTANHSLVQKHINELTAFLSENSLTPCVEKNIIQRSEDDKSIASINATQSFNAEDLRNYNEIILDISAMPRGIFLPLLNKLMTIIKNGNKEGDAKDKKNLHVIVTENATLDSKIHDNGEAEEGIFIHGLGINDTAKTKQHKEVWLALLGEGQTKQYDTIRKEIDAAEICPVLPFPSKDLKRSDKLIIEYQDLLFNDSSFDPKNIIYAHEKNPFQVYRLLKKAIRRYDKSLSILSGCKIIVSAFASKLLTVGAFLAVFESREEGKNAGIKHVESLGHDLVLGEEKSLEEILNENNLVELWLAGNPYE